MLFKTRPCSLCKTSRFYISTQGKDKKKLYSNTILLPQTKFPLRLNNKTSEERDALINNGKKLQHLYEWQRSRTANKEFILHDGPPYANGNPHMGHAINKILKDTIVRFNMLHGNKVHFVPGWDCHGLPIELKVLTSVEQKLNPSQIREKAKKFATETIASQREVFQSWGVLGDWNNSYTTFSKSYIKHQMELFLKLYEKGLTYRDIKPVYWSPSSRTALAEAELEYNPSHKSTAVTVRVLLNSPNDIFPKYKDHRIYALIWTTTPWTLPSNQAICFNKETQYSLVQRPSDTSIYIVASGLVDELSKKLDTNLIVLENIGGKCLSNLTYVHPVFKDQRLLFLHSDHTSLKGTGLVHTAPAHGPEDFLVGLQYNLQAKCMVNEEGRYTQEVGPNLVSEFVLTSGNNKVLEMIQEDIIHKEDYIHSYPYDWRTKQPVILRASQQWFINTDAIKERAIELLSPVEVVPKLMSDTHRRSMMEQLRKRPYWCISRQRMWGAPIPVFYQQDSGKPIVNGDTIRHLSDLLEKHGTDYWWSLPLKELLPENIINKYNLSLDNIEKGQDIFDIWFDSGISWSNVLEGDKIADLYLEGVDQFTGWFQSSLMTSVGIRDKAPYKRLYVHGFAVDENGNKMSKSLGNVIDAQDIIRGSKKMKAYGIDALRWWVVCHANQDAIAYVSPTALQASAEEVQKIRSVLRFAIGALHDYKNDQIEYPSLSVIDQYMLHLLLCYQKQILDLMNDFSFNKISALTLHFLTNRVSSLYYTTIKDRLYCDSPTSLRRVSSQYTLLQLFNVVSEAIAPILPHMIEEAYTHLPQRDTDSFFMRKPLKVNNQWYNEDINKLVDSILDVKKDINKNYGASTHGLDVIFKVPHHFYQLLLACMPKDAIEDECADILQVATVKFEEETNLTEMSYSAQKSSLFMCNRCRRQVSNHEDELCYRCGTVIQELNKTMALN